MVMSDESRGLGYGQNGDGNDVQPQPPPPQHENGESSKQNSIFSLTLDEIQSKSRKSFGSMNMDEFLANIWSVDENQVCEEQPNQGDHEDPSSNVKDAISKPPGSLSRQGSYSIPTPLCKKTVDEVWSEIDKTQPPPPLTDVSIDSGPPQSPAPTNNRRNNSGTFPGKRWNSSRTTSEKNGKVLKFNHMVVILIVTWELAAAHMGNNFIGSGVLIFKVLYQTVCPGMDMQLLHIQMFRETESKMVVGEASYGDTSSAIEKCHSLPESSGQRRMIKNRESAARSRARKQAYTVELEAELNQLQEENIKLKQCLVEIEQRRKQEVMRRKGITKEQNWQKS